MAKLGYIYNSYGKQFNIGIANTYSDNVLSGSNLPKNSLIISAPYDDKLNEDVGIYSLLAVDSEGTPVRLSYCISEGNGLVYDKDSDSLSLHIDEKSIITEGGKLKFNISYFIDNNIIKIDNDKIYIDTETLRVASHDNYGISKIDDNTIKLSGNTIYVNTTSLDTANNVSNQYGIGKGDEVTVSTNYGKFSVITENLRHANSSEKGIAKSDNFTTSITNGKLQVNTQNLERGIANKYGIVKGDEETIKVQNEMLSVITENLVKASQSNFGITKIDGKSIKKNSEGAIYMNDYDTLVKKIDEYKELKEEYDKKINDIREEIKNSPYQWNRKDIYLFSVNKTSMTELVKPKHMEEVINMPDQYVIAEFNIITGCDFYLSVNYDRFTNEFPPVTLVNVNYNDEVEYKNSDGLGITTVYPSTNGEEKKLILTFWAKNYNNSARDRNIITTIDVRVSSIDDASMFREERYSVVRYNSNYKIEKKVEKKEDQEKYIILTDRDKSYIIDPENGISYGLDEVIPWHVTNVILTITGRNTKTGEEKVLLDNQAYSLYEYRNFAWQGYPYPAGANPQTYYNDISILVSVPTTINERLSVVSQEVKIKKEVYPKNTTFQLTNPSKRIELYSYNLEYIKVKERVQKATDDFSIVNGVILDNMVDYSTDTSKPNILSNYSGITVVREGRIKPKIENTGYYSIPLTYSGETPVSNASFIIKHTENTGSIPSEAENHDEFLDSYFTNVSLNTVNLELSSYNTVMDMTYGQSISNIYGYIAGKYSINNSEFSYIQKDIYPNHIPPIYFNVNDTYTSNIIYDSYIANSSDLAKFGFNIATNSDLLGYNVIRVTPASTILLDDKYKDTWQLSYTSQAYFAYYDGLGYDLTEGSNLNTKFNVTINIKSDPYLTVSGLFLNSLTSDGNITNLGIGKETKDINVIQTYSINGLNPQNSYITSGEFMLTYKYYVTNSDVSNPTITLKRTELVNNECKYIYEIKPPSKYYDSPTIPVSDYDVIYTYYDYYTYTNTENSNWVTDEAPHKKEWKKYVISGTDKILSEITLDKGYILEAYFTVKNVPQPSDTVLSYAYSIISYNLFDSNQIYALNNEGNNNIYLINEVQDYYLPNNLRNNISENSTNKITIQNINNLDKSKTISRNIYLGKDPDAEIYNITDTAPANEEELLNMPKYKINIINQSKALATHAALVYIYNHPNEFKIENRSLIKNMIFDYEIDTSNSPNSFYLFLGNSDKVYTTKMPLSRYVNMQPLQRMQAITTEYMNNNDLWNTLKAFSVQSRTIEASSKRGVIDDNITTVVNIPYLDEIGLWDELFCPLYYNANGFTLNTNLLGIKVTKASGDTTGKRYILSINRENLESTIRAKVINHIGNEITQTQSGDIIVNNTPGKKNTFDYTNSYMPSATATQMIYEDELCSVADAFTNQWKKLFTSLQVLFDPNTGDIIMPVDPGPGATPAEQEEYQKKKKQADLLQEYLKNSGIEEKINSIFTGTNTDKQNYHFAQSSHIDDITTSFRYDINLFHKDSVVPSEDAVEYKFSYIMNEPDADGNDVKNTVDINIDEFVCTGNPLYDGYQDSIINNLYTNNPLVDVTTNYPDGFKTFKLYANMLLRGYTILSRGASHILDSENDYYLRIINVNNSDSQIPMSQDAEFIEITGMSYSDYMSSSNSFDNAGYSTQYEQIVDKVVSPYYSVSGDSLINNTLKERLLYNSDGVLMHSPAYYYFTLKDRVYTLNDTYIRTVLKCDPVHSVMSVANRNYYTYQYGDGTQITFDSPLFRLNIGTEVLNNYLRLRYTDYYNGGTPNNSYSNYNTSLFIPALPTPTSSFHELLKATYDFEKFLNEEFLNNPAWEADPSIAPRLRDLNDQKNRLVAEYAELSSLEQAQLQLYDNFEPGYYPWLNGTTAYIAYINSVKAGADPLYSTRWWNWDKTDPDNPIVDPPSMTRSNIIRAYDEFLVRINDAIGDIDEEIISLNQQMAGNTAEQNALLTRYNSLYKGKADAYDKFNLDISQYSTKEVMTSEINSFYARLETDKNIITNKLSVLETEYDVLLKAFIKKKILETFKLSKEYETNITTYNLTNTTVTGSLMSLQASLIDSYVAGALKEVDYVLAILENSLLDVKNIDALVVPTNADLNDIENSIFDIAEEYHTNFEIFNNIIPKYKLVNKFNILYFNNIYSDDEIDNTQYFIKYKIDNNSVYSNSLTQQEVDSHQIFTGTMKYEELLGNYVHIYEYYNNYFVKEIINPITLFEIPMISNGFGLELNIDMSNNKFYNVKYNEDGVSSAITAEGYPQIVYRKNKADIGLDSYDVLYTTSNNIPIENNLTMLSLQKDYIIYDNHNIAQYVCGNREYFVVNSALLDIVPYYGNLMFSSSEIINKTNPRFIFDRGDTSAKYKIIDYNIYFASSNLLRSRVSQLTNFYDSLKIFSYIKDYYNENESLPPATMLSEYCSNTGAYTNNLIWKYCKNKDKNGISYFKVLNYSWVEPQISSGSEGGSSGFNEIDITNP